MLLYLFYYHYCYCYYCYCYCYYYDYFITSIRTKSSLRLLVLTGSLPRTLGGSLRCWPRILNSKPSGWWWQNDPPATCSRLYPTWRNPALRLSEHCCFFLNMQGCLLYVHPSCSNELDWSIILFKHVWLALLALRMLVHWIPRSMRAGFCFCWPSRDPTEYFHGWISYVRSQDHQM